MVKKPPPGGVTRVLSSPAYPRKYSRGIWKRVLLALALFIGVWFLGVRPFLHHQALVQLDTAWESAELQGSVYLINVHQDQQKTLVLSDRVLSDALNTHDDYAVQHWQVTVTPENIRLSFAMCGQLCIVTAILSVSNNKHIQVICAQAQGMFTFILSDDELMEKLRNELRFFCPNGTVTKITLLEHAISIQIS